MTPNHVDCGELTRFRSADSIAVPCALVATKDVEKSYGAAAVCGFRLHHWLAPDPPGAPLDQYASYVSWTVMVPPV